jgi:hypothetical protein
MRFAQGRERNQSVYILFRSAESCGELRKTGTAALFHDEQARQNFCSDIVKIGVRRADSGMRVVKVASGADFHS